MSETETTEDTLNELQNLQEKWSQLFKEEGQDDLSNAIQNEPTENLTEPEFISNLKQLANTEKHRKYIDSLQEDIREIAGPPETEDQTPRFKLERYKDLSKARLAQEMADHCVYQLGTHPVDIDRQGEQTELYQYNRATGAWEYLPKNQLGRLAKEMAEKQYTRHLKREFRMQLYDHIEAKKKQDFGLPENEVLLADKNILQLDKKQDGEYQLRQASKEDRCLYRVKTTYDPDADCPRWKDLVKQTLNEEENQIKTLQEYMGWLLKYSNRDFKKALIILGVTNSGKSQLADVVAEMFSNNALSNLSMNQIGNERRFHIHRLGDAIVNVDRDMSGSNLEGIDTIKQAISQEEMAVEPKGEDSFTMQPQAKFMVCSNVAPNPDNASDGAFFGRFLTLKAPNQVPQEDIIPNIGRKIFEEEASGILNWMLEGLERLEEQGRFTISPSAYETKMMWNEYGHSVDKFVFECVEKGGKEDYISIEEAYEEYEIWVSNKLDKECPQHVFKKKMMEQPFVSKERRYTDGGRPTCFVGLKLETDSGNLNTQGEDS